MKKPKTLVKPFYMWAGGKTKLLKYYVPIWPTEKFSSYVEPFFGGGAVYSWLKSNDNTIEATVSDVNGELTGVLNFLKKDLDVFVAEVNVYLEEFLNLENDKETRKNFYYKLRQKYWESKGEDVALLFVLMKLGFNGIWQTCKQSNGLFATPAGLMRQTSVEQIYNKDNLAAWHDMLQNTSIQNVSYADLQFTPEGALIYLDPPYRDSFTTYGTGFDDVEQIKLVNWALEQAEQGATVLLANRCVDGESFFEDLLPNAEFHYFDVTYTAGRRKKVENGFEAKPAREFLAIIRKK